MNLQIESVNVGKRRFRLQDLALVVFTIAVMLASLRGVGSVLVDLPPTLFAVFPFRQPATGALPPQVDSYRVFAIGLVAMGIGLTVVLLVGLIRQRNVPAGVIWRVLAIAVLTAFLQRESDLLSTVAASNRLGGFAGGSHHEMQVKVVSFGLAAAIVGILLCLQPARDPSVGSRHGLGLAILRPLFASIVGLALLTGFGGLILYLVLIAIEAVRNALQFPGASALAVLNNQRTNWQPQQAISLQARIDHAALVALGVLICGLVTAAWLGNDLRSKRERLGATQRALRLLSVLLTGLGAVWLSAFEISRIQPHLVEGLVVTIWPVSASAILGGFFCLSLGLAAQGTAPGFAERQREVEPTSPRKRMRTIIRGLVMLLLAYLTLGAFSLIWPDRLKGNWMSGGIEALHAWMDPGSYFATSTTVVVTPLFSLFRLEGCVLWGLLIWLGALLARVVRGSEGGCALDVVFQQRGMTVRFMGRALALIVLMMAVFPAFLVLSLEIMRYVAIMTG